MDGTYKTNKLGWSVYTFLVTDGNRVGQAVYHFLIKEETTNMIKACLSLFAQVPILKNFTTAVLYLILFFSPCYHDPLNLTKKRLDDVC